MTVLPRPDARLYVAGPLAEGASLRLDADRAHYLKNVLRLAEGRVISVFDGATGEWLARIEGFAKQSATLSIQTRLRPQGDEPDIWLLFAPIKRERIDLIAEKATELGASRLMPVFTRHTVMSRVNTDRLRANAVEAAEQCERLSVPQVDEPVSLERAIDGWPDPRPLFFCAESGPAKPLLEAANSVPPGPFAVLVGPEGGFAQAELDLMRKLPFVVPVSLGPRILRAETAVIAALSILQARLGDGRADGVPRRDRP